jgi:predicted dehydrogenase
MKYTSQFGMAGTASPYFIPSKILGRSGNVPPGDRIAMACVGLGGQGTRNLQEFIQHDDVQITALCDVNEGSDNYDMLYQYPGSSTAGLKPALQRAIQWYAERGKPVAERDIALYRDYRELMEREDIDAVSVCTPDHWHALVSIAALKAGKDVYCEKPLANSVQEGRAVCKAVTQYGGILQTGSHERSNDSVRYACELIRNGRIGKIHTVRVNMPNRDNHHLKLLQNLGPRPVKAIPENLDYDMWLGPSPWRPYCKGGTHFWWRYILECGGGEMTDRGAHIIDLAQMVLDVDNSGPVSFKGAGWAPENGLYNSYMEYGFECAYADGVKLIGRSDGERGIKFEGSHGSVFIHIHGGRLKTQPASLLREIIGPNEIHLERSPGHHRDFLNCVKTRRQPIVPAETGHRTATICHLLNIAFETGKTFKWDPESEQITNETHANRRLVQPMRSPWHVS